MRQQSEIKTFVAKVSMLTASIDHIYLKM